MPASFPGINPALTFGVELPKVSSTVRRIPMFRPSRLCLFRITFALALLVLCTSCAELEEAGRAVNEAARNSAAALYPSRGYWNSHRATGKTKIVVSLGAQRAYLYKGKSVAGESPISTGKKGYETPPGKYRVIQKDEHHVSSIYGDYVGEDGRVVVANVSAKKDKQPRGTKFVGAKMPYFLRFTGGYGMHAGYVPRYRASHGCIRMPADMARRFYHAAQLNTPVIVRQ